MYACCHLWAASAIERSLILIWKDDKRYLDAMNGNIYENNRLIDPLMSVCVSVFFFCILRVLRHLFDCQSKERIVDREKSYLGFVTKATASLFYINV